VLLLMLYGIIANDQSGVKGGISVNAPAHSLAKSSAHKIPYE